MLEEGGTISDCTNTHHSGQNPQGIWVSSVLPLSLFPAPCNNSDFVLSSWLCVTAVWSPLKEKLDESQDKSLKQHYSRI